MLKKKKGKHCEQVHEDKFENLQVIDIFLEVYKLQKIELQRNRKYNLNYPNKFIILIKLVI